MTNEKAKKANQASPASGARRGLIGLFGSVSSFQDSLISRLEKFGCPDFLITCFAYLIGYEIFAFLAGWRSEFR